MYGTKELKPTIGFNPVGADGSLHDVFLRQTVEYVAPGKAIFFEGDPAAHVFEVIDGALRVFKIVADGRRVITGFLYSGDFLGISLARRYLYSAEAICGTTVKRLSRAQLDVAINEYQGLRPAISNVVSDEIAAAQDQMVLLACKNAEQRLCAFLLRYLRRAEAAGEPASQVILPMCRQDIADYLGMSIETVCRTVTKLIARGAVRLDRPHNRQTITIVKPCLLAQIAGEGDREATEPFAGVLHSACSNSRGSFKGARSDRDIRRRH